MAHAIPMGAPAGPRAMIQQTDRDPDASGVEMSATEHHATRMPAQRARQGVTPGHVRYMLATGLALAIVALTIVYGLNA